MKTVSVLTFRPVNKAYTYRVPQDMMIEVGDIVSVPLGSSQSLGIVWDDVPDANVPSSKLKPLQAVAKTGHIPQNLRHFIDWVAHYTLSDRGMVAKMAMPVRDIFKAEPVVTLYTMTDMAERMGFEPTGITPQRRAVLEALQQSDNKPQTRQELLTATNVSDGVLRGMVDKGLLIAQKHANALPATGALKPNLPPLNPDQSSAVDALHAIMDKDDFSTTLIDGVTGSGKTEVYFHAMDRLLAQGKQCLVMVPEIALTDQFIHRFEKRFGVKPHLWHSTLSQSDRRRTYKAICTGDARVIVGARSALFLPYKNLGLIIVDEEHDSSYKQEDQVMYHARDMAVKRAQIEQIPIILVSATPSLETHVNALEKKYHRLHLPDRHGGATMPDVHLIDMRKEEISKTVFLSPTLIEQMHKTLARQEQVLLFLNRRGYAPLTLCRSCGHRIECPNCTAWLVEHRDKRKLSCHHCGFTDWKPKKCPKCDAPDSLVPIGPGVERIRDDTALLFPEKRILVLSSDTQSTPEELKNALHAIHQGKVDIIIGTQIIAKGHHFPALTMVGVIDADLGLSGGDLRASERTYQLLHQVSGRAGRQEKKGHVYLQSYEPEHRVMKALTSHTRDEFLMVEVMERQHGHLPPFGRLTGVIVSSEDEKLAEQQAFLLARSIPTVENTRVLGPVQAPIYKLRKNYRWRLLIKAPTQFNVQRYIQHWLSQTKKINKTRIQIDIDPQSFV